MASYSGAILRINSLSNRMAYRPLTAAPTRLPIVILSLDHETLTLHSSATSALNHDFFIHKHNHNKTLS